LQALDTVRQLQVNIPLRRLVPALILPSKYEQVDRHQQNKE
jgi:hypothetical protein